MKTKLMVVMVTLLFAVSMDGADRESSCIDGSR